MLYGTESINKYININIQINIINLVLILIMKGLKEAKWVQWDLSRWWLPAYICRVGCIPTNLWRTPVSGFANSEKLNFVLSLRTAMKRPILYEPVAFIHRLHLIAASKAVKCTQEILIAYLGLHADTNILGQLPYTYFEFRKITYIGILGT